MNKTAKIKLLALFILLVFVLISVQFINSTGENISINFSESETINNPLSNQTNNSIVLNSSTNNESLEEGENSNNLINNSLKQLI